MKNLFFLSITFLAFAIGVSDLSAQQWQGPNNTFNSISRTGRVGIGSANPEQLLTLSSTVDPVLRFERVGGGKWDMEIYAASGGHLRFRGGKNGTGTSLDDLMVIRGNGKVVIATENAPTTYGSVNIDHFRLFVGGGILTEELIVKTNWADYVFAEDYKLPSLQEVETHIQEKGHLHNTPSATEIENSGLNVGSVTVNQQEKIEELFLHMIKMEKRVNALEKENASLKMQISNASH